MLTHGGDLVGFAEQYGIEPLDFSVNTNPFGLSPRARTALTRAADRACAYPDPLSRRLCSAISHQEQVPTAWITCGNGAADLIWRIALAVKPTQALLPAPTFSEYETALHFTGCQIQYHPLCKEQDFRLQPDILSSITNDTDILFLCNPNNPTGLCVSPVLLQQILERCRCCGTLLVVDECFLGFLSRAEQLSMKSQLAAFPNLLILKAFTKLYGMAGLRLGYCLCSDTNLLAELRAAGQCWPVSVAAEEAGIAALQDADFVSKMLAWLPPERSRVARTMAQLGLTVWPGEANYLFFQTEISNYPKKLAEKGILIRDCSNYIGLSDGYCRAAILLPEQNDQLLKAMKQIREECR